MYYFKVLRIIGMYLVIVDYVSIIKSIFFLCVLIYILVCYKDCVIKVFVFYCFKYIYMYL